MDVRVTGFGRSFRCEGAAVRLDVDEWLAVEAIKATDDQGARFDPLQLDE